MKLNLSVDIAPQQPTGLRIANPVMVASGTFGWDGYGRGVLPGTSGYKGPVDFQRLGAVIAKTVTRQPRVGNPEPRWFPTRWKFPHETIDAIYLNSVGLTNPGIEAALEQHAPMWAEWRVPVIASIAGSSIEEFASMAAMADGTPGIEGLELNLSCPNIEDGAHFSHDAQVAGETVRRVKASTSLPVIPKLSPNVPDITPIAEAVVDAGADAITICNTIPAMGIDVDTGKPVLGGVTGGISGPGLRPVAVALIYRVSQIVGVPIIGVGGVFTARNALELMMAGATAVQVGSANLASFWAPVEVLDGLISYMGENGVSDLAELVGVAHP